MKYRYENFGGIVASENPPFLAFVDRNYMRELGLAESDLWRTKDRGIGLLSSPVEVHMSITNRCSAGCAHCYLASGDRDADQLDTNSMKRALDVLARKNVFHVALGGGEALEREDLFEIAAHARSVGLVPNLTISGRGMTQKVARAMKLFGQVNVSMDGIGSDYGVFRGGNGFEAADRALDLLVKEKVPAGINAVLGRRNAGNPAPLFHYAREKGLNEIEFLRLKPAGRADRDFYLKESMTHAQHMALVPELSGLSAEYGVAAKIDCSFVPMLCWHRPPTDVLTALCTYGCEAGNVLLGVRSNGAVSGCSFLAPTGLSVFELEDTEKTPFSPLSTWAANAPDPCRSCDYLDICKGGCRAVALAVCGDMMAPDPHCPRVVETHGDDRANA